MKSKQFITEFSTYDGEITRVMTKKGYKLLGSGVDQTAFLEPGTGQVLKIFGTQPGTGTERYSKDQLMFIYWANYCAAYKNNPFLPKFSGWETFDWKGNKYLQIRMERLGPLPDGWAQALSELAGDNYTYEKDEYEAERERNKQIADRAAQIGTDNRDSWWGKKRERSQAQVAHNELVIQLGREGYDRLLHTLEDLFKTSRKKGWGYDLHGGNFMIRNDSTPVIVDPWVVPESDGYSSGSRDSMNL